MTIEAQHDLHSEFPQDGETLHALKLDDAHFRTLAERYNDVIGVIHRIEAGIDASSDTRLEDLKKQRLNILDEVAALIASRRAAV